MAAGQQGTTVASSHPELFWIYPRFMLYLSSSGNLPFAFPGYKWPQSLSQKHWAVSDSIAPSPTGDALLHVQAGPTAPMVGTNPPHLLRTLRTHRSLLV